MNVLIDFMEEQNFQRPLLCHSRSPKLKETITAIKNFYNSFVKMLFTYHTVHLKCTMFNKVLQLLPQSLVKLDPIKKKPCIYYQSLLISSQTHQPQVTTNLLLSISMDVPILHISHKCNEYNMLSSVTDFSHLV